MTIEPTGIPDVLLVEPSRYGDERGFFSEVFRETWFDQFGLRFVQDNHSLSAEVGTIRGLHFQVPPAEQAKLVRVTRGAVVDVAVDVRRDSATYGEHVMVDLSAANWRQLLVPPGFAHGFCTTEPDTEVLYKVSAYYDAERDFGLRWDDPELGIEWPVPPGAANLSERDQRHPGLAELPAYF